jgi:hypothetical protein
MQVGQGIPMAGLGWGDYTIQPAFRHHGRDWNLRHQQEQWRYGYELHQRHCHSPVLHCYRRDRIVTTARTCGRRAATRGSSPTSTIPSIALRLCPKNYYRIPSLHLEVGYTQYGWADRQRWVLSSDAGARTRLSCSTANCPNGFSFHTDWMHGWDMVVMNKWLTNCSGVMHNIAHQCAVSQISATEQLVGHFGCGANNRCPQVDVSPLARLNVSDPGWGKIPPRGRTRSAECTCTRTDRRLRLPYLPTAGRCPF